MAIGTKADFKVYDDQYFGGQYESISQNLNAFNGASNGAMVLTSKLVKGDFSRESFMNRIANLIQRRDPTAVTTVTDVKPSQSELVNVKVNKRIGPVAQTLDAWKKIAEDPAMFSFYVGKMVAEQKLQNMVNTALAAVEAALRGQAALGTTTAATITHNNLVTAMSKLGDQSSNIACWVFHSKPFHDLIGQAITDKIFGVANVAIYAGSVATLGKPSIVIDAPGLLFTGTPNTYATLGLQPGAVEVTESEVEDIEFQKITGFENLMYRLQGEYAYNVGVRGMAYAGAANPDDTTLSTPASWTKVVQDDKHLGGVRLLTQ